MDRAYIDERQVIERYLRGTLTPDELGEFELYMLDHPEIVDDLEYANGLRDAIVAGKDELFGTAPIAQRRERFWLGPRYAMAATVLLLLTTVSSVYLLQRNAALTADVDELGSPRVVPNDVWLEIMRGNEPPIVEKGARDSLILRIATDARVEGPYEVRIRSMDNGFSWSQSRVFVLDDNSLRIVVRDLPLGTYELTATSEGPMPVSLAYRFRVVVTD